jgi:alpha-tubulin suppressor-like RCC1 family protein
MARLALLFATVGTLLLLAPYPASAGNSSLSAVAIAAGRSHTCALTTAGGVTCWGADNDGQLGDGREVSSDRRTGAPIDVVGLTSGVAAIEAALDSTCALTTAGRVKCWGVNFNHGPQQCVDGPCSSSPVDVPGLDGVAAIGVGMGHACAVTTVGALKCWGDNSKGQLGDGSTTTSAMPVDVGGLSGGVTAVAAGQGFTCALKTSGEVDCWGDNSYGQLGDATNTNRRTPAPIAELSSSAIAISAGHSYACALRSTGAVVCWGENANAQLGDGTIDAHGQCVCRGRNIPGDVANLADGAASIAAGFGHACAVTTEGAVSCWGFIPGTSRFVAGIPIPVAVVGLRGRANAVAAGNGHTCAIITGGAIQCWGSNSAGELGTGEVPTVQNCFAVACSLKPVSVVGFGPAMPAAGGGPSGTHSLLLLWLVLAFVAATAIVGGLAMLGKRSRSPR